MRSKDISRNDDRKRAGHAAPGQPRWEKVLDRAKDATVLARAVNTVADLSEQVIQLVQALMG